MPGRLPYITCLIMKCVLAVTIELQGSDIVTPTYSIFDNGTYILQYGRIFEEGSCDQEIRL